jgi:two-component system, OmpR family, phosphate regulon sensor histidine kinase PhoR
LNPTLADGTPVLIVDDEESIRDATERILTRMGCRVFKAAHGERGLEILAAEQIPLVLLDLKMPGIDGMEVLRRIRERKLNILVIIITGFATIETAIEAMKRGAYDFITKPFEPDQLRIVVNRAIERVRLMDEAQRAELERQRTLADLDTEKSRIRTIIESLPSGVVVTNADGQVVLTNPAFVRQMGLPPNTPPGKPIGAYIRDELFCSLVMDISQGKYIDFEDIPTHEFNPSPDAYFMAGGRPVLGERNECMGAVITLVDITAMKVLDRLKSEFVAKVSHELRSPLATIHEQLAMALKSTMAESQGKDQHILSRAQEKTKGLISLIGDLLDLSRIEEGVEGREPEAVRLDELLQSIVDFLGTTARSKQQALELEIDGPPLPVVKADPLALESIVGNLVANALNYTPEGGQIRVSAQLAGENIRIVVADNGFGIEAEYLDKIFDRFYRVKNDKTRYIIGTGLGLPIVKGLVDSLGGSIEVSSAPGEGSAFTVLLPLSRAEE